MGLIQTMGCLNIQSNGFCEIKATGDSSKWIYLDNEKYKSLMVTLNATEVEGTCAFFPNTNCLRFSTIIQLEIPIIDVNDVFIDRIEMSNQRLSSPGGGESITIYGENFGLNIAYIRETKEMGTAGSLARLTKFKNNAIVI